MFSGRNLLVGVLSLVLARVGRAAPTAQPLELVRRAEPHEVAALLKRAPIDPSDPGFRSNYPPGFSPPSGSLIPQLWLDRLRAIEIPSCPRASRGSGLNEYGGRDGRSQNICSFPYGCTAADDLKDPRPGWIGLNFDDGPAGGTDELYNYLVTQNATQQATHFMIGSYILNDPTRFLKISQGGGHIAVHTWSHRQTTTLSNEEIVGELGWTMQIMSDLNGGRIPKFWRPPYGDVDNRVRAIAKGVFGLETVVWNEDTADWNIGYNPQYTIGSVSAHFEEILRGPKTRGLNILEHEITTACATVFRNTFPKIAANGWRAGNIAEAFGMDWYQNSAGHGNTDPVASMQVGGRLAVAPSPSASTSTTEPVTTISASASTTAAPTPVTVTSQSVISPSASSSAATFTAAPSSASSPGVSASIAVSSNNRTSAATALTASSVTALLCATAMSVTFLL